MSTADSEIFFAEQGLRENEELLKHNEQLYKEADQKTANWIKWKINLLLERRRKLYQLLEQKVPSYDKLIKIDNAEISSNSVIVGNLVISLEKAGKRRLGIEPEFCERLGCGGLINYDEVFPKFEPEAWELNHVGCKCP